jgi:hypothetical protein
MRWSNINCEILGGLIVAVAQGVTQSFLLSDTQQTQRRGQKVVDLLNFITTEGQRCAESCPSSSRNVLRSLTAPAA